MIILAIFLQIIECVRKNIIIQRLKELPTPIRISSW